MQLVPSGNDVNSVCDWWFNVDCSKSVGLYPLNKDVIQRHAQEPQGSYMYDIIIIIISGFSAPPVSFGYSEKKKTKTKEKNLIA